MRICRYFQVKVFTLSSLWVSSYIIKFDLIFKIYQNNRVCSCQILETYFLKNVIYSKNIIATGLTNPHWFILVLFHFHKATLRPDKGILS